jgi:hypothetical protein
MHTATRRVFATAVLVTAAALAVPVLTGTAASFRAGAAGAGV